MSITLKDLNPPQREAASQYHGASMILAGAGTGKTRVITARIAYMLENGVIPDRVAAMTFTNKAAREMRERVGEMVSTEKSKRLSISTFHSFCLHILRRWPKQANLQPGFVLASSNDQLDMVRRAMDEHGWSNIGKPNDRLAQISMCKNALLKPEEVIKRSLIEGIPDPAMIGQLYATYERQLHLNQAIDFDDCIFKVWQLLKYDEKVRQYVHNKFHYILVDEFQDTNYAQFQVIRELGKPHSNVCVVGDDDQSIYSWRGAMSDILETFERSFPNRRMIKLEQNYRCSNTILHAANTVIQNNTQRKDKVLWSASTCTQPISLKEFEDAGTEARWVARECTKLIRKGVSPSDIGILYRTNGQSTPIEMALREEMLPSKTFGGQSFFERKEVRDFLAYIRLCISPKDALSLWRIINIPLRGIGLKTQEYISAAAQKNKTSPLETMGCAEFATTKPLQQAHAFAETLRRLRRPLTTPEDLENLGTDVLRTFKLEQYLKDISKNPVSCEAKIANLRKLPAWLRKISKPKDGEKMNIGKVFDQLALGDSPYSNEDNNEQTISLMSIHASKGLEFPAVFLVGLEEGCLPHKNNKDNATGISEERRLFYVALTRAKEHLYLSYSRYGRIRSDKGISTIEKKPSRFLDELPEEIGLNTNTEIVQPKEVRKESTLSLLSRLKKELS
ncbi:MAG: ATP-dependent helicase [Oligoflexales bacterium]